MRIYNPIYGALFEIDENQPADPKAVGEWTLNYTSPTRGLTPDEISEIKTNEKIGSYPDEFFLVDPTTSWTIEKTLRHQQAVQAFQKINENGPLYPHWDHVASINRRDRIAVNFVPGPIVDQILAASSDSAVEDVYRAILDGVGSRFRAVKEFQDKAREHAHNLVQAVKEAHQDTRNEKVPTHGQDTSSLPTRERILRFVQDKEELFSPREIADKTGLNRNTVRRELQQLLKGGLITCREHKYGRRLEASPLPQTSPQATLQR